MSFSDYKTALRMRDLVRKLVREEVDKVRPRYRYAVVETIDRSERRATVIFGDENESVPVSMGAVQPKEAGQVVRIHGLKGDRFISDVMGEAVFIGTLG